MSDNLQTAIGKQLYYSLPEVYRSRDAGDLAAYLDACGELLDRLRATLDQFLADSFPDNPPAGGRACQPWLLPYFAQLLDVRLFSPDEKGRRTEVAQAVAWRQRKGTLTAIEQIAEAVGQMEVEVQEGWRRTAMTPRLDTPRLPAGALGEEAAWDDYFQHPLWAARHPDLPAATVDLRYPTRAMQLAVPAGTNPANPAAKLTRFAGQPVWWRQVNPHGAPCFPGSYEDVSRRTVDLRTPDWRQGHSHPRRVILYAPPPPGIVAPVQGGTTLSEDRPQVLENLVIDGVLTVTGGTVMVKRCAIRTVEISVPAGDLETPALSADDSIFGEVRAEGLVRLEHGTVLDRLECGRLQASDSLLPDDLSLPAATAAKPHCVRFSRIPGKFSVANLLSYRTTPERPVFYEFDFNEGGGMVQRTARIGEAGCGVLHPAAPAAIRFGAEDGGEMGAYHAWRYCLLMAAVLDKLKDFLPVGMEAVIVPDQRLTSLPLPPC